MRRLTISYDAVIIEIQRDTVDRRLTQRIDYEEVTAILGDGRLLLFCTLKKKATNANDDQTKL